MRSKKQMAYSPRWGEIIGANIEQLTLVIRKLNLLIIELKGLAIIANLVLLSPSLKELLLSIMK